MAGGVIGDVDIVIGADPTPFYSELSSAAKRAVSSSEQILQSLTRTMGSIASSMGKTFSDTLTLGAKATGTTIATVLGASLTKGMGRLKAIDNAEASLRGLAATAGNVPEIMEAATNAVTGTAFGLDQAAAAAAQFGAANVPVADMEKHLSSLASTAAAAGGDFDAMSAIFSKVAARGKVTGDVLTQLTSHNIAGLQALADHFGKTTEEVQDMVSKGEVSFEDFSAAMDKAMGNVAIEQASTFTGLIANVGAAMGRMGAVMQKPFFDATKAVLPGVINLFDQFTKVITPLAEIIADRLIPFAERLGSSLEKLDFSAPETDASTLFGTLGALAPVVGGLAAAFAGPLLQSLPVVGSLFSGLNAPVGILLGSLVALFALKPETLAQGFEFLSDVVPHILDALVYKVGKVVPKLAERFAQNAPVLIEGFAQMFQQVASAIGEILPILIPVAIEAVGVLLSALLDAVPMLLSAGVEILSGLVKGIVSAVPQLVGAVSAIISSLITALSGSIGVILEAGVEIVLAIVEGIVEALPQLLEIIPEVLVQLITALMEALPMILEAGIQIIVALVEGIATAIPQIIDAVVEILPRLIESFVSMIPTLIETGIQLFMSLVEAVVTAIPQIIAAVMKLLPEIISSLVSMIPALIEGAFELFLGIIMGLVEAIPDIVTAVIDAIPVFIEAMVSMIPDLIGGAIELFLGIVTGLIEATPQIIMAIIEMIPQIITALIDAVPLLIQAGMDLIAGLVDGLWQAASSVGSALLDIAKGAIDSFKSFLGISSPAKMFINFGENIGQGLVQGIDAMGRGVENSLEGLIPASLTNPSVGLDYDAGGGFPSLSSGVSPVGGMGAGLGGVIIQPGAIVIQGAMNPEEISIMVMDRIAEMAGA